MSCDESEQGFPEGALGVHYLWDLKGVSPDRLNDLGLVEKAMLDAAAACGATVLGHRSHQFEPQGVTVVVLLAESHLAIHSWPEKGEAAVDFFSCSPEMNPKEAKRALSEAFSPIHISEFSRVRG